MMLRQQASLFGWFFLLVGVLGFTPGANYGGVLLGLLHVSPLNNLIH